MVTRPTIGNLLEEVMCRVRLEHMKDPVSIFCGCSFYQACITECCVTFRSTQGAMCCPFCKKPFQEGDIRPKWILASLVSILLTLESRSENLAKQVCFCEQNKERPFFHFQEDQQFPCVVCKDLIKHECHWVLQKEEGARSYEVEVGAVSNPRSYVPSP